MGQIQDASPRPWRMQFLPARFRQAPFHVEAQQYASGRRIALHEYPKRDDPYAEDMGRMRRTYDVTGYLIEYDKRVGLDYRKPRDRLIAALEEEAPGQLVLPTLSVIGLVRCMGYSTSESRERGGYCTFEMKFIEYGRPGNQIVSVNTQANANAAAGNLNNQAAQNFADRWAQSGGQFGQQP